MAVEVRVTAVLQKLTGGKKSVPAEGETVDQLLRNLDSDYPGFLRQVQGSDGRLHRFVNIYLNDEDIRYLGQLETPLKTGDVVSILPALAGGVFLGPPCARQPNAERQAGGHMLFSNIIEAIGNTPLVELPNTTPNPNVRIYAKLEGQNPSGSV